MTIRSDYISFRYKKKTYSSHLSIEHFLYILLVSRREGTTYHPTLQKWHPQTNPTQPPSPPTSLQQAASSMPTRSFTTPWPTPDPEPCNKPSTSRPAQLKPGKSPPAASSASPLLKAPKSATSTSGISLTHASASGHPELDSFKQATFLYTIGCGVACLICGPW